MSKWIAEFELEDGDTMPEHMDLEYRGVRIDFHCKPLEQEPTTKNELGVDAISRADARSLICNTDIKHHMSGMSRKAFKDLYNGMDELPPVTLIRPKGHWTEEFNDLEGEVRFTCSSCGKYQLFGTDFCYHCGSDNREVEDGNDD